MDLISRACSAAVLTSNVTRKSQDEILPAGSLTGSQCKSFSFSLIHPQSPWSKLQLCIRTPTRQMIRKTRRSQSQQTHVCKSINQEHPYKCPLQHLQLNYPTRTFLHEIKRKLHESFLSTVGPGHSAVTIEHTRVAN